MQKLIEEINISFFHYKQFYYLHKHFFKYWMTLIFKYKKKIYFILIRNIY